MTPFSRQGSDPRACGRPYQVIGLGVGGMAVTMTIVPTICSRTPDLG